MSTYVVGDIHGCFREWIQLKCKIESQDDKAEFILTGDIIDKGSHSMEMVKWAMEKIGPGKKYQMVLGNHEHEKLQWLNYVLNQPQKEAWKEQQVAKRMLSADGFVFFKLCCEKNWNSQRMKMMLEWLQTIPDVIYREIQKEDGIQRFIIMHDKTQKGKIIKEYRAKQQGGSESEKQKKEEELMIIYGHTPTTLEPCKSKGAVPGKIWKKEQEINVDCGMVYGVAKKYEIYGDLAALRLEDFKEFYYYDHYKET